MARPADPTARASLIAAARAEFVRKGIRGARIEDITAACGLSKGAFYLHFESKEALFRELMAAYKAGLDALVVERLAQMQRFFAEHGRLGPRDVSTRSERYRRLLEVETEQDLRTLELLWAHRDVLDVLIRGAQGTEFESFVWDLADREVERVVTDYQQVLGGQCCVGEELVPELFGSLIVGTFVLLAKRMTRLTEKPDLAAWARTLQHLVREGCMPRHLPEDVRAPASKTSTRPKARASTRSKPRKAP
jgi:AcrR family transcriptional regulator